MYTELIAELIYNEQVTSLHVTSNDLRLHLHLRAMN
jgi:hypothetical protein